MELPEGKHGLAIGVFIAALLAALALLAAVNAPIARSDTGTQQCMSTCVDAPRLGSFIPQGGEQLFGLTQDRGRTTFTFWNGVDRPAIVELGRMVQGTWTPYRVSVKFDRAAWPVENQPFGYMSPGAPQLVTMTTTDAAPGDHVEVRAYWQSRYLMGQRDQFYPLAGADLQDIAA